MASTYPTTLDTFATTRADSDATATTHAADHNNNADAINKIEAELGVNPSASFIDVATRLNLMTTVRKTADQNFTTTTLANVTDLVFPVVIGSSYRADFLLVWSSATAGVTVQFAITWPAATYGIVFSESPNVTAVGTGDSAANATDQVTTSIVVASGTKQGGIGGTSLPAANAKTVTRLSFILQNVTTAGNIQVQAAAEAANTTTVFAGSHGILFTN